MMQLFNNLSRFINSTSFTTTAPERARPGPPAALHRGQIHGDPDPGGRLPAQGRGRQFHRKPGEIGCRARSARLPGGKNAGDEQAEAAGDQRLYGLTEGEIAIVEGSI